MPRFYLPLRVFQHQYFSVPLHSYTLLNNNMGADLGENPPISCQKTHFWAYLAAKVVKILQKTAHL